MSFTVIVADPPWAFGDALGKRGAEANYPVLDLHEIARLPVVEIAAPDSLLALWVPKSMLADGLYVMEEWGFDQKTMYNWTKRTKTGKVWFGMGRTFRATGEVAIIGTRGKATKLIQNKGQRDHCDAENLKHSAKPECLQDSLDLMFPEGLKLEIFARRQRPGWMCVGNEAPDTMGEDVRDTMKRLVARVT